MKYQSIVISGPVASGTSTAAKALAKKLNLKYYSVGDFMRKYSLEHNIPLYKKEDIPDEVDRKIDKSLLDIVSSQGNVVVDALYFGYFTREMPYVLKVLLTADEEVRVDRALARTHTHKETAEDVKRRDKAHDAKFRKLYANANFLDPEFFDLIIDTTNTPAEEVVKTISKIFLES